MPHDKTGEELKEGDIVFVKFKITNLSKSENDCNVMLLAIDDTLTQTYLPYLTCNSKLVNRSRVDV